LVRLERAQYKRRVWFTSSKSDRQGPLLHGYGSQNVQPVQALSLACRLESAEGIL
jgi:hypothetical protein